MELILGQVLQFTNTPFDGRPEDAATHIRHGAVLVHDGTIADVGDADTLRAQYPTAQVTDMRDALLSPGFVDTHVHYPQTAIIASWGKRLIDWLNSYTFPEESRFGDADHATQIAETYFDLVTAAGTTTTVSYCTIHPESVDAYFTAAQKRGLRVLGGKTCMDRNAPDNLRDTAQSAYDDSKMLLDRWHGQDRLSYVITPRFAPTSTPEQLEALGALWAEHPDVLMQTHISEQHEEIAWVADLFPDAEDYLYVYEQFGLVGKGALLGHAIHLTERERDRIRELDASLIHCPTSNMFIGSGLFDMQGLVAQGHRIGLATDTGGGSSFSMLRTMAAAYEVGQLSGKALHPAQLWWLATAGSAQTIHMGDRIGRLAKGYEADIIAVDLKSTPAIAQRTDRAATIWEALFPTIMMGDDRAISAVWAGGQKIK
ncbi:guanine deaminase [Aliiroseovarius halocynthiae]|uniref:Guanine deaminase n=1 Tax=Aliiroseovarius halocynthiae TaxID=985055 RepID=A0A545STV8_9RHOB|nr:guanine deaminase [Aliiroseovarius halocynthiae]TQV68399.1 guanine deaminase [Aliiroseovarius halocynthiae]SMR70791.1 guanine deaminase [Aliiroseovarius halocynthiae]